MQYAQITFSSSSKWKYTYTDIIHTNLHNWSARQLVRRARACRIFNAFGRTCTHVTHRPNIADGWRGLEILVEQNFNTHLSYFVFGSEFCSLCAMLVKFWNSFFSFFFFFSIQSYLLAFVDLLKWNSLALHALFLTLIQLCSRLKWNTELSVQLSSWVYRCAESKYDWWLAKLKKERASKLRDRWITLTLVDLKAMGNV